MQNKDKDKHNDHLDDFSKLIQQKLENHRMPVDIGCWNEIESRINPTVPRNKVSRTKWIASIAAVAAFIAIILLVIPDNKPLSEMASLHQNSDFTFSGKEYRNETADESTVNTQSSNISGIQQNHRAHTTLITVTNDTPEADKENKENVEDNNNADTDKTPVSNDNALADKEPEKEPDEQKKDSEATPEKKETKGQEPRIMLPKKVNNNDKWLLAASVSSTGNNFSSEEAFLSSLKDYSSTPNGLEEQPVLADPGDTNNQLLATEDYSNVEHSLPLSFGLTVRKDINKYIGVETGLVYTYLSSTFERVNIPHYKTKQELHYLGVPVNLVVYLLNDPKWNVYVSGGVMLEKGLRNKSTQDMYQNNEKTSSTTEKKSIKGVQWSLNASAGVSYAFYEDLSLYVEPRFSHFFDNDQPLSVRTEKSNVFGLGGGLRYKF